MHRLLNLFLFAFIVFPSFHCHRAGGFCRICA